MRTVVSWEWWLRALEVTYVSAYIPMSPPPANHLGNLLICSFGGVWGWGVGVGLAVSIFHKLPRLTGSGMLLEHGLFFEHQGPLFSYGS